MARSTLRLCLRLLGGFEARLVGGRVVPVPPGKAQALLAYLALPPGRAHPRDKLAALLWGNRDDEPARNSLRQAIFVIRQALGRRADCLQTGADGVALDSGIVDVDAVRFEALARAGTPASLAKAAAPHGRHPPAGASG